MGHGGRHVHACMEADHLEEMGFDSCGFWTEGQYMLPDTRFGHGMLTALGEALTGRITASSRDWTHRRL